MAFYRWLSPIERSSYLAFDTEHLSPRVNQFVIEGSGGLDFGALRRAVKLAADVHPGARLILKGLSRFCYWDDAGPYPLVSEVDGSGWDGKTARNISFLYNPMSVREGPTVHIVSLTGPNPRILMRSHHAVMDGPGSFAFLQDVFRILRNETPIGSNSTICDFDVFKQEKFGNGILQEPAADALPTFGKPQGLDRSPVWKRVSIPGAHSRSLQKVAMAIAAEARSHQPESPDDAVRLRIPVDLRRHLPENTVTTANCVSAFDIEIDQKDNDKTLFRQMVKKLKEKQELNMDRRLGLLSWIPVKLFRMSEETLQQKYEQGKFARTGTISHLGQFPVAAYSCPGFTAKVGLGAAPRFDLQSIYVGMWDHPDTLEVLAIAPHAFGGNGRLERFMDNLPNYFENHFAAQKSLQKAC